jgi:hypothetical protein
MPTRLYFANGQMPPVAPAFSGAWFGATAGTRYVLKPWKDGVTPAVGDTISINATLNRPELDRQYVTYGLDGPQTIAGLCSGQLMVREFAANDDVNQVRLCAKVVSNDGATVRGTLLDLANYGPTAEFISNASLRNKTIVSGAGNVSVNSINAEDGDRIVLEIGYACAAGGTTPQAAAAWGGGAYSSPDLPINETQTTAAAGWFDLGSVNLRFRQTQFISQSDEENAPDAPV